MITLDIPIDFPFPMMHRIHQHFRIPPKIDVVATLDAEWDRVRDRIAPGPGARIAVGVGSRGIADLVLIVRTVVARLRSIGAEPFITPAMGSHGGATAEGQIQVLARRGITEASVGAPIIADMDVVSLGAVDGIPLYMGACAHAADGIVLVNRVKPHTDFSGPVESGIMKMLVIGLGNQKGADFYHRTAVIRGFYDMIVTAGRALLVKSNFLFGVACVENQDHATSRLRLVVADEVETTDSELLNAARGCLPTLPLDDIDLLIVDRMGKDISGAGLDPNVVGVSACKWSRGRSVPRISRIFVRDLTVATDGNATGIGVVDIATRRLIEKIDYRATAMNAMTSCCIEDFKLPMTVETEREAIAAALMSNRPYTLEDVRIMHIENTLALNTMTVSAGCLPELADRPDIVIEPDAFPLAFAGNGALADPFP